MSLFRPTAQIFHRLFQIQQFSPISTTAHLLSDCKPKKPKGQCKPIKSVGCAPRARPDCNLLPKPRIVCHRLEVAEPSYAECVKDPKPKHRKTECFFPKMPPKECIKPNPGISLDGCQPQAPPGPGTCRPRNLKPKSEKKKCDPKNPCDPDLKPFKSAGPTTSPAMSCPSAEMGSGMSCPTTPMTSRMCEPESQSSPFTTPFRNYSTKCKKEEPKKSCFEKKKTKAKAKSGELSSPVSCSAKRTTKSRCEQAKCLPPFEPCGQPRGINQHKCPIRKKKPRMMSTGEKKRKINMGYKVCNEPKALEKFSCKPKPPPKKKSKPPPTPTRCPCFKPQELEKQTSKSCKKMPGASASTCNRKEQRKPACEPPCDKK